MASLIWLCGSIWIGFSSIQAQSRRYLDDALEALGHATAAPRPARAATVVRPRQPLLFGLFEHELQRLFRIHLSHDTKRLTISAVFVIFSFGFLASEGKGIVLFSKNIHLKKIQFILNE